MPERVGESRAPETMARLRAAAVEEFAERGFHATTTRRIAERAGTSTGTIYVHLSSKEELLYRIAKEWHSKALILLTEAVASSEGPVEQLRALFHALVELQARDHLEARVVNQELDALSAEHGKVITEIRLLVGRKVRELIETGVALEEFVVPDIGIALAAVLSLGVSVSNWYRPDGTWTPEYLAARYSDIALRIVGYRDP